jgi:prepilin-type N-terminal cleavage/methylation domain-containing protein
VRDFLKKKINSEGFSLLETLVVIIIVGIISLVIAQLMTDLNSGQIRALQLSNRQDFTIMISNALRSSEGCKNTLLGQNIPLGPPVNATAPQQILAVRDANNLIVTSALGGPPAPIIGNFPDKVNQASLRNIRFQLWVPNPTTPLVPNKARQGWFRLNYDLFQTDGSLKNYSRDIPITVVPDSSATVSNCYASGGDEFCAALGGAYDVVTNRCNHIDLSSATIGSIINKLEVLGGIKVGNETKPCDASLAGTIRYTDTDGLEYCNGSLSSWERVYPKTITITANPAKLCEALPCLNESIAQCPAGYVVTGGGGNIEAPSMNPAICGGGGYTFMVRSYPKTETSWAVLGNCSYFRAYAICAEKR